jgi:hypothetical protein
LRTSAAQSATSRLNNEAADSCSTTGSGTQDDFFVDFIGQRRRSVVRKFRRGLGATRGSLHEACEQETGRDASGYEQTGIALCELARVADEIVDAAVAQPCRKIADGPGQPVGQVGDRRFVVAELSSRAPDRLCELIDACRGRAFALLEGLAAVFLQALCEPAVRAR